MRKLPGALFFLLIVAVPLSAQTIRGRVTLQNDGSPLPGVTVSVDGFGVSAVTNGAEAVSAAPPDRVFGVLTDWPRHAEWMPFTSAEGGDRPGAELRARTSIGPIGFLDTMVITEWEPPRRAVVQHTGRIVRGPGFIEVETSGDGAVLTWTERLHPPFGLLGEIGAALIRPFFLAGVRLSLRRFARFARTYPA